jgi:flagellar motor switch protein FliG
MIEAELNQSSEGIAVDNIIRARKEIASSAIRLANAGSFELPQINPGGAAGGEASAQAA